MKYGFPQSTINNWCMGNGTPTYERLAELCKIFNVTAGYLLGTEDKPSQRAGSGHAISSFSRREIYIKVRK